MARGSYDPPTTMFDEKFYGNVAPAYSFVTVAAEVEVDTETGQVEVLRIVAADDVGRALNPLTVEGQLHGQISQALGYALFERMVLEGGQVVNGSFADYTLPKAEGMPKIESILVETIDPNGPFGAKGASECAVSPPAPAVANAIYHATGVRMTTLPITPEKLLAALREKRG